MLITRPDGRVHITFRGELPYVSKEFNTSDLYILLGYYFCVIPTGEGLVSRHGCHDT